eukprot:1445016-Karenia_brevis.AAC.1
MEVTTDGGARGREEEEESVVNRIVKESMAKAVAQEMLERASQLSNESVEVEAPKEAREQVAAASSKSAASNSKASSNEGPWEPALPSARK